MNITSEQITSLIQLTQEANRAIMEIYDAHTAVVEWKADNSPLTQADKISHQIITQGLIKLFPGIPVVSEEGDEAQNRETIKQSTYWLVDPIDGTKDFITRTGEFCIAIGLIDGDAPRFGFVSAPTLDTVYYGGPDRGSFKQISNGSPESIHTQTLTPHIVAVSRSHSSEPTQTYIAEHYPGSTQRPLGSMLKQVALAEGTLDLYPCIGQPLHLWDLAAGLAIIEGAGGRVQRPDGSPINWHETSDFKVGDFIAQA